MIFENQTQNLFENLPEYNSDEVSDLKNVLRNKTFKKFIKDILRVKADSIAEDLDDPRLMKYAKYTRMGNKQILDLLEMIVTSEEDKR